MMSTVSDLILQGLSICGYDFDCEILSVALF